MDIETIAEKLYDEIHMPLRVKFAGVLTTNVVNYKDPSVLDSTKNAFLKLAAELPRILGAKTPAELKLIMESIVPWLGQSHFDSTWWTEYLALLPVVFPNMIDGTESDSNTIVVNKNTKIYMLKASKRKFRLVNTEVPKTEAKVEFKFFGDDTVHEMWITDFEKECKEVN